MKPLYTSIQFNNSKSRDLLPFECKNCGKTIYRDINSCCNFAINEEFVLSGTDFVGLDFTKPTHTFNLNHNIDSFYNLIVTERLIKEKSW